MWLRPLLDRPGGALGVRCDTPCKFELLCARCPEAMSLNTRSIEVSLRAKVEQVLAMLGERR